jgi:UDP-2,3-diacylglucosamine pyrophosphatase LpxH
MLGQRRKVYIVSDLHLGGAAPTSPGERGFQICTQTAQLAEFIDHLALGDPSGAAVEHELVINGDFVDFLAEPTTDTATGAAGWTPLREDAEIAAQLLLTVVSRCPEVFAALRRFVQNGHTLTVLLGNHDIELAYPQVRRVLQEQLGVPSHVGLRFVYDGEAYAIGDALIEHGNRYDSWNAIDYDALRRVCSLQSRGQAIPAGLRLPPPAGSQLVAEVMNPIKRSYPFIDLLKPESTAAVPLLLALEPGSRKLIAPLAKLAIKASDHKLGTPALPTRSGDISATPRGERSPTVGGELGFRTGSSDGEAELRAVLGEALGGEQAGQFLSLLGPGEDARLRDGGLVTRGGERGDIAARPLGLDRAVERESSWTGRLSWLKLILSSSSNSDGRLRALQGALRAFCDPSLFEMDQSPPQEPLYRAAQELAKLGRYRYIVMGHTHLARDLPLATGGRYLNSGTWADLMRVPDEVFSPMPGIAEASLRQLVSDLSDRRYQGLIMQRPTYVRLELVNDKVVSASVETYRSGAPV